ncbi:unnamed protein product [Kuraishia capsulata CBS 1993]|uniref:Uncharacterized protein n=1 Tax=Kuraishia capsulata CBS 1993 TaxID=1382522 RepID=W6MK73_9ASCO|nr:uncharacterized protein KUCA_T00002710001 [Kuraishia capsulata CBS 1993]CDK26736.1 unnamed protein product [Kuraishia capsulata CBS 1993]
MKAYKEVQYARFKKLELENIELKDKTLMLEEQVGEQKLMITHLVQRLNEEELRNSNRSSVSSADSRVSRLSLSADQDDFHTTPASSVESSPQKGKYSTCNTSPTVTTKQSEVLRHEVSRLKETVSFLQSQNHCYQMELDESYKNQISKLGSLEVDYHNLKQVITNIEQNSKFVQRLDDTKYGLFDNTMEHTINFDARKLKIGSRFSKDRLTLTRR